MKNFNAALLQTDIIWHDINANLEHVGKLISFISPVTSLAVLPEMFSTGFTMEPSTLAEDMSSRTISTLKKWSNTSGADITGSIIIKENGYYYNRLVWTSPDGTTRTYDKRHLFRIAGENNIYTPGSVNITVTKDGWRIMPVICYDLRFPAYTRNIKLDYDILLFTANWPASRQKHWDALLRARAIENQCYVIGVNRTGRDGNGLEYRGGSVVFDFMGEIIARAGEIEEIIQCVLEYGPLIEYRKKFPFWMDADNITISR